MANICTFPKVNRALGTLIEKPSLFLIFALFELLQAKTGG
jgi:hypothetical protein